MNEIKNTKFLGINKLDPAVWRPCLAGAVMVAIILGGLLTLQGWVRGWLR